MACLVVGCNHWIGFHIVNELLANDLQVDGIEDTQGNELLSLFFGRNSSFSFVSTDVKKHYDTIIFPGKEQVLPHAVTDCMIGIGSDDGSFTKKPNSLFIHPPILFGEWMPMEETGFYDQQQVVAFDSERLKSRGVYMKDFAKGLIQWMSITQLPAELIVKSIREKDQKDEKQENVIYLRDNVSVDENIKKVREHYERYKASY